MEHVEAIKIPLFSMNFGPMKSSCKKRETALILLLLNHFIFWLLYVGDISNFDGSLTSRQQLRLLQNAEQQDDPSIMNWKRCGRRRSYSNLR
jgi:hypothetical protein